MRLALKTATRLLATIPKLSPSFSHTRTVILPLHSRRPAKTLLRLTTPSFQSSACIPMSTLQVRDKIELSAIEKSIFDRLIATLTHFQLQTQLRVAGGWVRDKVCTNSKLKTISSPNLLFVVSSCFLIGYLVFDCW